MNLKEMKQQEGGDNLIMMSFIIYAVYRIHLDYKTSKLKVGQVNTPGGTEENREKPYASRSLGRDLQTRPSEYEAVILTIGSDVWSVVYISL